jgi:hypothetical protein
LLGFDRNDGIANSRQPTKQSRLSLWRLVTGGSNSAARDGMIPQSSSV